MAFEIERKFLVNTSKWTAPNQGTKIKQGYLGLFPSPTVRIRIAGDQAFLTIKGRSETIGRPEFEYEVPAKDALEMLKLAISEPVEKTRYEIMHQGFLWQVDLFARKNQGLVMAEIELETELQEFPIPDWILKEVTGDERFYNSYLSIHPYQEWNDKLA